MNDQPIDVTLHGLSGGSHEIYLRHVIRKRMMMKRTMTKKTMEMAFKKVGIILDLEHGGIGQGDGTWERQPQRSESGCTWLSMVARGWRKTRLSKC